jgi:hypothetical protein
MVSTCLVKAVKWQVPHGFWRIFSTLMCGERERERERERESDRDGQREKKTKESRSQQVPYCGENGQEV